MSPNQYNARFLKEQAQIIRDTDNHPLRFLLGSNGELMTLSDGYRNYYDASEGAIFEGRVNDEKNLSLNQRESSLEASETLGCSVSVDACHVLAGSHGGTRLALGIAERNRADGSMERHTVIENEVVEVCGVHVFKQHLREWSEFGLCDNELIEGSLASDGWTAVKSEANDKFLGSVKMSDDVSENARRAREELARDFYLKNTNPEDPRSSEEIRSSIEEQLKGIRFDRDVSVENYKKGDIFGQARDSTENIGEHARGSYFFKPGDSVEGLGIAGESSEGKQRSSPDYLIATRDGQMLKSTAADVPSWYREGSSGELLYGGSTQYYTTERENFSRIVDTSANNANIPEANIQSAKYELAHREDLNNALFGLLGDGDQQARESLKNEIYQHSFDTYCQDAISAKPDSVSLYLNTETRRTGNELSGILYSLEGVQGDRATSLINMETQFRRDGDSLRCDSNIGQDNDFFSTFGQNTDLANDCGPEPYRSNQDFSSDTKISAEDAPSDIQARDGGDDIPVVPPKDTTSDY